jgi:Peptidase family M1 domain
MIRLVAALLLAASLAGCMPRPAPRATPAPVGAEVDILREGEVWTARFRFGRAAPVWVFVRSSVTRAGELAWRAQTWTVETAGVRLERRGRYDVLIAEDGGPVPAEVRLRFTPFAQDLLTDSAPAMRFTTGATALFSRQFDVFGLPDAAAAGALPVDISTADIPFTRTRATFRDAAGPLLYQGRRVASVSLDDQDGTYVLFGPAEPVASAGVAAIYDPALPAWIRTTLGSATPTILARLEAALGQAPGARPLLMVSWAGATPRRISMTGSVLPNLLAMTFEGEGVLRENAGLRDHALWFIAHEAAHFWLGDAVVYEFSRDAWITEGGADLLAFRTVAAVSPAYDWRGELQKAIDDCVALSTGRGVAGAEQRGEQRAYYACGVVFGLVAEAASHRPFGKFVRRLVDANRADRVLTRGEWLAALDRVSSDPSLSADIARLLDRGDPDPAALIASLFTRAGVRYALAGDGRPRLM